MGLDYTNGCVNFRDVGEWVNEIAKRPLLPVNRLYRGGKIDFVTSPQDIGMPGTIFNLRKGPDLRPRRFAEAYFHFPISNDYEKYETKTPEVRSWLQKIIKTIEEQEIQFPLLIHCSTGKDRTGVVIAALLSILGINREVIIEEYLLSDGEVKHEWIEQSLYGIDNLEDYFRRVNLDLVRSKLKNNEMFNL
ncbi:tyrosine-protein phosphatase [bacterium]|nr:tyrosine-protein phosphatase [bacterium]